MKTVISVRNKSTIGNGSCLLTWFTLLHFKHVLVSGWISFKNKTPIFHFLVYFMKFTFKNIPPYNLTQLITEPSQQFSTLASFYSTVDFSSLFESESLNRLWVILDRKLFLSDLFGKFNRVVAEKNGYIDCRGRQYPNVKMNLIHFSIILANCFILCVHCISIFDRIVRVAHISKLYCRFFTPLAIHSPSLTNVIKNLKMKFFVELDCAGFKINKNINNYRQSEYFSVILANAFFDARSRISK